MAIFFALLTLVGWAVGDIFIAVSSRRIGNIKTLFWGQVFAVVLTSLYIPFAGIPTDWAMFFAATVLGFVLAYSTLLYFKALEVGNASLAGTVGGSFLVLVVIISILFFGEKLALFQSMGIILVTVGVTLASLNLGNIKSNGLSAVFSDKGVKYALVAMVIWGVYYAVIRIPIDKIGWFWTFYPANFFFIIFLFTGKVGKGAAKVLRDRRNLLTLIIYTLLITMAQFAYNLGLVNGFASVVAPIAGSYPVFFVVLTRIVFKEKLTGQQKLGILSSLGGILLISFASV